MAARAFLLAASVLLAGCGNPPLPREVRIAYESDALTLDPMRFQDDTSRSVQSNVYEGLVAFDRSMNLVPALAVGWTNPDERTWEFRLREGVVFHDGAPLAARDVKDAFDLARDDSRSTVRGELSAVEAIEAVGAGTLRVRTRQPAPFLLSSLADVRIARASDATRAHLAGTGPYRVARWEGGRLETEAFDRYWGSKPAFQRALFVKGDVAGSVRALARRQLDVVGNVPATLLPELGAAKAARIVEHAGLLSYYLWLDCGQGAAGARSPFTDRRVREAMSLAIDRARLVERLGGHGAPLNQIAQKGVLGHVANLPELRFDPGRARRLLREAGWPSGAPATLAHGPDVTATITAEALREMLERAGVRVLPRRYEWAALLKDWRAARLPLFLAGWRENGDPTTFLRDCLFTRSAAGGMGSFNPGYSNATLDRLIEEADHAVEMDQRLARYERVTRLVMDDSAVIPLYTRNNLYGISTRIRWEPRLDGKLLAADMSPAQNGSRR
jgi:peptide/nickel transport system substrate-binding protein